MPRLGMLLSLCLGVVAVLTGCGGGPQLASSQAVTVVDQGTLPPPTAGDISGTVRPYHIGPLDKLDISVFGVDGLEAREIETDASGQISFPLVGSIQAAGLTTAQLAAEIERRLRGRYVREPQVTVNLNETVSQVVTVDGQVTRPGLYPVRGGMRLSGAVASAGGLAEFADLEDVVIFRTVEGQRLAALYNLSAIRAGRYEDPLIYGTDLVVVGDSKQRRLFKDLLQLAPLLTSPLILLLQG